MNHRFSRLGFLSGVAASLALPLKARAADLRGWLLAEIERIPATVGVCARTMIPGPPLFVYNGEESFPSASTIKLPIMLTAFKLAEKNPEVMDEPVYFRPPDLIGGSDYMQAVPAGRSYSVRELITPMIRQSDNTAANLLITHFGFDRINQTIANAGLRHTFLRRHFLDTAAILKHHENRTTPDDMAMLLYKIETGSREGIATVASSQSCRRMIDIMLGQTDRDKIPAGLPRGVPVANKTGEITGTRADIGIVEPFGDSPYVLCVYTKGLNDWSMGAAGIAGISRLVYRWVRGSLL